MRKRSTYRLLIQSEEKNRNILEIAVYGLVALGISFMLENSVEPG